MAFKIPQSKYSTVQVFDSHQEKFAHYNRLLHARTHVPPKSQNKISTLATKDPIKTFELKNTNNKLFRKLIEIYEQPSSYHFQTQTIKRKKKHLKNSHEKSLRKTLHSQFAKKQENAQIKRLNVILFNRIAQTKPSVGNWKCRDNCLTTYGKLTRRKTSEKIRNELSIENAYLQAFKNNLSSEKKKRNRRKLRNQSRKHSLIKDQNPQLNKNNDPESNVSQQYQLD